MFVIFNLKIILLTLTPVTITISRVRSFTARIVSQNMADRLTQLQDAVNHQAENFCNSIGLLQLHAPASKFPDRNGNAPPPLPIERDELSLMFAALIARCAKDIDFLIESLPSEESSTELQLASLRRLEQENHDAALKLKEVIGRGEQLLERVQQALSDISQAQIEMQRLENDPNAINSSSHITSLLNGTP